MQIQVTNSNYRIPLPDMAITVDTKGKRVTPILFEFHGHGPKPTPKTFACFLEIDGEKYRALDSVISKVTVDLSDGTHSARIIVYPQPLAEPIVWTNMYFSAKNVMTNKKLHVHSDQEIEFI